MGLAEQLEAIVRDGTPPNIGKRDYGALLHVTAVTLKSAVYRPRSTERSVMAMDMMVARASAPAMASVSLGNFFRQFDPLNPRAVKEALAAGSAATGLEVAGAGHLFAFIVAVTVLATRTVNRPEAMTLHLAWKTARADRSFTLSDIMARADQLRDDYEVDKVNETDVLSYLNNLARAGSLRSTSDGYEVVERIYLAPF